MVNTMSSALSGIPEHLRLSPSRSGKHRRWNTPEWSVWRDMRARCLNPKHRAFHDYGGRGISIDPEWQGSFSAFLRDVGERPSPAHSLDRIDNDLGYRPGNVRWATDGEQTRNTRAVRLVTFMGREMCLAEACRAAGLSKNTVGQRLFKGWSVERALSEPLDVKRSAAKRSKKG